ncbi:uncharacterized protein LOC126822456 [Patella vulgata]|uniref:uncharacterized protein LOC126822456 n=1 Tax=Patella vulgata TaxID=6465 RepID=UPI0024A8B8D4|nr:uncharacterized protein LOC126822456 [Patella vulgata]
MAFNQYGGIDQSSIGAAICRKLQVNRDEQDEIERATRGQTYSPRWFKERQGRITASKAYRILQGDSPYDIVQDIMATNYVRDAASLHGNEQEPNAIKKYIDYKKQKGDIFTFSECGLMVDLQHGELAATPDGIVTEGYGGKGVLEVKCPFSVRDMTPFEAILTKEDSPYFPLEMRGNRPHLKTDHRAYYQVQMEMAITGCQWCDFVLYTNLQSPVVVVRVRFDQAFWNKLRDTMLAFHRRHVIPKLISTRF